MFGIGLPEMILILALALIVVGPDKLPDLARSIARGIMELKKTAEGLKQQFNEEDNPLGEIKPDLEEAAKTFKSHMLDHPEKGTASLFPAESAKEAADSAAKALSELQRNGGVDTTAIPADTQEDDTIDLSADDLTEVVPKRDDTERDGK